MKQLVEQLDSQAHNGIINVPYYDNTELGELPVDCNANIKVTVKSLLLEFVEPYKIQPGHSQQLPHAVMT